MLRHQLVFNSSIFAGRKKHAQLADYVELDTIGTGTFGICKKVQRKTDGEVSMVLEQPVPSWPFILHDRSLALCLERA